MKVLVTGADGFIGSHLTETLLRQGHQVKALAQYNSFSNIGWLEDIQEDKRKSLEIVFGDVRDSFFVDSICQDVEVVFHLAALIAIPYSYSAPSSYVETNVTGTLNVMEAAKKNKNIKQVLHTSTSEVYGSAEFIPISETHPLKGQSPYSASKIGADQIAFSYYSSFETPVTIIRPFNTYGPRQSARAIIPTIITQIAAGKKTIQLGALDPTRDLNFVQDTVNGFIAAMGSQESFGEVINIGSGFEISIGDLAKSIAEVMDEDIQIELDPNRLRPSKSEVTRLFCDNQKAKRILNWEPEFGQLEGLKRGLEITANWFKNPENLKKYNPYIYNV